MKILLTSDTHRGHSPNTGRIAEKWAKNTLAALDFDVLVHAGDMASTKQEQVEREMKFLRKVAGERPVLVVRGNHDFWNDWPRNPDQVIDEHRSYAKEHGIHLLDEAEAAIGGVLFVGWMGWYADMPRTNDFYWIPKDHPDGFHNQEWFKRREYHQLDSVLVACRGEARPVVAVTHFPIHPEMPDRHPMSGNPRHFEFVRDAGIKTLLYGHSHRGLDQVIEGVRCVNAGSDYDRPRAVVVEIEEPKP